MADVPEPITRLEQYWAAILDKITGGSSVTVEELDVSANDTYTAPEGTAYSPVVVDVPNTYVAGDEDKVVRNGELVAQTEDYEITADDTYDTTTISSVIVNVSASLPPLMTPASATEILYPYEAYSSDGVSIVGEFVPSKYHIITKGGTLDAPFSLSDLAPLENATELYGYMVLDGTAIGLGTAKISYYTIDAQNQYMVWCVCDIPDTSVSNATGASIIVSFANNQVTLVRANLMQQGTISDITQYASLIQTLTVLVYHEANN